MSKRPRAARLSAVVAAVLFAAPLAAQQADTPAGLRGDLLRDLAFLENRYVSLAEAVPQERYGWRPGEGVRSVSEVFMHVAAGNYLIAGIAGHPRPAHLQSNEALGALERVTEKPAVVDALRASFAHAREAILATQDARLDEAVQLFGRDSTVRATLLLMLNHLHEHLGQSIAYARTTGTVPPWSAGGN